eukprot:jgi/Tetstr1/454151/TSEL_041070.t1
MPYTVHDYWTEKDAEKPIPPSAAACIWEWERCEMNTGQRTRILPLQRHSIPLLRHGHITADVASTIRQSQNVTFLFSGDCEAEDAIVKSFQLSGRPITTVDRLPHYANTPFHQNHNAAHFSSIQDWLTSFAPAYGSNPVVFAIHPQYLSEGQALSGLYLRVMEKLVAAGGAPLLIEGWRQFRNIDAILLYRMVVDSKKQTGGAGRGWRASIALGAAATAAAAFLPR